MPTRCRAFRSQSWVFPNDRDAGVAAFETPARRALAFFGDLVGPYLYEKLANVETAGVSGGMEHASAIAYGEDSVTGKPVTTLVAHEIAHAWFGNGVTERDWDDVWLSEGFATYLTHLFVEHVDGRDAFVAGLRRDRNRVAAAEKKIARHADRAPGYLGHEPRAQPVRVSEGGMGPAHAAGPRRRRGVPRVRSRVLPAPPERHGVHRRLPAGCRGSHGAGPGAVLQAVAQPAGIPSISGTWRYRADTKTVEVVLQQVHQADPFQVSLEIAIEAEGQPRRIEKVELTERTHRFEFAAGTKPSGVVLDPDTRVLAELALARK